MGLISLNGDLLSGKTTVAKLLSRELGYTYYTNSQIVKDTLDMEHLKSKDNLIIDGNISVLNEETVYRVYLKVSNKEALSRYCYVSNQYNHVNSYEELLKLRGSDKKDNLCHRNINTVGSGMFDIVINTNDKSPKEISMLILDCFNKTNSNKSFKYNIVVSKVISKDEQPCKNSKLIKIGNYIEWVVEFDEISDLHSFIKENGSSILKEYEHDSNYLKLEIQ